MKEKDLKRLSDCEVQINKYYHQIQDYIKKNDNLGKNVASKNDFENFIKEFQNKIQSDLEKLSKEVSKLRENLINDERNLNDCIQLTSKNYSGLNGHAQKIDNLSAYHDDMVVKYQVLRDQVYSVNLKVPDGEKINKNISEVKENLFKLFSELQKDQDKLRWDLSQVSHDSRENKGKIANNQDLNLKLHSDHNMHMDQLKSQVNEIKGSVNSLKNEMKVYVDRSIENIPKPKSPQLPDFDAKLNDRFEQIYQKVMGQFNNLDDIQEKGKLNEIQMIVLDKKLDNILQILSKNGLK